MPWERKLKSNGGLDRRRDPARGAPIWVFRTSGVRIQCGVGYREMRRREGWDRPRISRAIDTPNRKPLAKWVKLVSNQNRRPMPRTKANEPDAVNRLRRIILPS